MIAISKSERKILEKRFPKAEIVATRHHSFLVGRKPDEPVLFLYSLRGGKSPQKEKDHSHNRFQHLFSERSRYTQNRK